MANDNNEKPVRTTLRLCRVRGVSTTSGYEPFTQSVLRHLIFNAEPRVGSGGTIIPGNGLASAIVRIGRTVLIDLDRFDDWIESHREGE